MQHREVNDKMLTTNDVANQEMENAKIMNLPEPDFDFRSLYKKGDKVYFTRILPNLGIKELLALTIQIVYARTLIAFEAKGSCYVIGYKKRNFVFANRAEALDMFESVEVKEVS